MGHSRIDDFFDNHLRSLVVHLEEDDKVELIRFMVLSFIKASRLYYKSIGFSLEKTEEKIGEELEQLKLAFDLRLEQTMIEREEELKEFDNPNETEFDQFVSDATIELYFLLKDVGGNNSGK